MKPRVSRILALASLLIAPLVALSGASPTANAGGGASIFEERWCSEPNPAPCLLSVTRNDLPVSEASTNWEVQSTGKLFNDGAPYFMFLVADIGGPDDLATTDRWVFVFDTGTMDPQYTEGFAGTPVPQRIDDSDGTYRIRYEASPILYTYGCDTDFAGWPWPCTESATDEEVKLEAEVWKRAGTEFDGFHRSQSPQGVNGIFLETASDGSRYLESEMVNSHFRLDEVTLFEGEVRFRIPYAMLRDSFGVPTPSTMVAESLSGTVNGSTAPNFTVVNDTVAEELVVDFADLTFSRKILRVKRGVIVPTKPTNVQGFRVATNRAKMTFMLSTPRGAKVTGYQGRCESPGGHVVSALKTTPSSPVKVGGLRSGVPYSCKVRAKSKAGYGPWSASVSVPRNPPS